MKKSKLFLWVLVAFLIISGIWVDIHAETLPKLTTEKQSYSYQLKTDGVKMDYKLFFGGNVIKQGTQDMNNQKLEVVVRSLTLNLSKEGEYKLEFKLRDDVENVSQTYTQVIVYKKPVPKPAPKPATAKPAAKPQTMPGVAKANPSGKNNSYQSRTAGASLTIDRTHGKYSFSDLQIPAPILTQLQAKGKNIDVYGQALSKQSFIKMDIYEQCGKQSVLNKISLNLFNNCKTKKQGLHYLETIAVKINHIRLGFYNDKSQEIDFLWQENSTDFKKSVSMSKLGKSVKTKVSIYGEVNYSGESYKYDGLASGFSNSLNTPKEKSKTTATCNGQLCKTLNVNYFNQGVNEKGKWEVWKSWPNIAGGQSCGAASSVMVNGFFGKLPSSLRLKSYVFQDNGQELANKKCSKPGAFAVTASDKNCNQSSLGSIQNYLSQYKLKTKVYWPTKTKGYLAEIKQAINKGHPVIISYRKPIGHILVIKGFTYNDKLVVNDPYRDFQNNYIKGKYDYSGKDAIYSLIPNDRYQVNYLIEVYK